VSTIEAEQYIFSAPTGSQGPSTEGFLLVLAKSRSRRIDATSLYQSLYQGLATRHINLLQPINQAI
jgi:hypothetical protein